VRRLPASLILGHWYCYPTGEKGTALGQLACVRSKNEKMEEHLRQIRKWKGWQLTASSLMISNNLLTVIIGTGDMAQGIAQDPRLRRAVGHA